MRRDETGPAEVSLQEPHHGYEGEIGGLDSSQNRRLLAWKPKGRTAAPEGLLCLPIDALASFQTSHNKVFTVRPQHYVLFTHALYPFLYLCKDYLPIYLSIHLSTTLNLEKASQPTLAVQFKGEKKRPFPRPCISRRLAFATS